MTASGNSASGHPQHLMDSFDCCTERYEIVVYCKNDNSHINQSRTNGPINAHLTIAQFMPKYNHNNEKQEALLLKFRQNICSSTAINSTTKLFVNAINTYVIFNLPYFS